MRCQLLIKSEAGEKCERVMVLNTELKSIKKDVCEVLVDSRFAE